MMKRRSVLSLFGSTIPLAGCSSSETVAPNGSATDEKTPSDEQTPTDEQTSGATESAASPNHAEDIFIVLQNQTPEQITAAVTVITDDSVSFEDEATVDPDEVRHMYPGITERGDYELTVSLPDGPERTRPFSIEEYDIRIGSNITVWISEEGVGFGMEE